MMLTGQHWVRDAFCKKCNHKLGWMYEFAKNDDQKYKESKVILEKNLIRESNGLRSEMMFSPPGSNNNAVS